MSEIILGGYPLSALKAMMTAIAKDAQAFISEQMKHAEDVLDELRTLLSDFEYDVTEVTPEMQELANKANEILTSVDLVSGISGVGFWIDYYEEYGHEGDPFSAVLDDAGLSYNEGNLSALYNTLEKMEQKSLDWHSSKC